MFRYGKKLFANEIYDELITRLFRNLLHKSGGNSIVFAWRGKTARKEALEAAILHAKRNFAAKWGTFYDVPTRIVSGYPSDFGGLQVIDYYLWAIQRLYERREDRFFNLLQNDYKLIMDIDDLGQKKYGAWYSSQNPLTIEKISPLSD